MNETGSVERNVSKIDINEGWDTESDRWNADIAVVSMSEPVQFSRYIQPICLPVDSTIEVILPGFVVSVDRDCKNLILKKYFQAGWGISGNSQPLELIPRQASLTTVSNSACFLKYHLLAAIASENTFCAGGNNAGPCNGDSGSHNIKLELTRIYLKFNLLRRWIFGSIWRIVDIERNRFCVTFQCYWALRC